MERDFAVLVIGNEERTRSKLREALGASGWRVCTASSPDEAMRLLGAGAPFDALVLDAGAELGGVEALRRYREGGGRIPVVAVGASDELTERLLAGGANECVAGSWDGGELARAIQKVVLSSQHLPQNEARIENRAIAPDVDVGFVSVSEAMRRVFEMVDRVADADVPVMIRGESGVGKDVVARAIHARSSRRGGPFVKINCAALPSELLESELFGHEKGAFTGAHTEKPGKFEIADGGTIFLDELGEMHVALQAKLLQVLQDEEFYRVGGRKPIRVDARVVVATNRELEAEIEAQRFREDLYYRLNVVSVKVPPLRERKEDILPLVEHFIAKYAEDGEAPALRPDVMRRFLEHDWPGNVRELENMVRRLVVLRDQQMVLDEIAVRSGSKSDSAPLPPAFPEEGLKEIARRAAMIAERDAIEQMLKLTGWNKRKAALRLKISYKALLYKIKECGICDPRLAHARGLQ
ncbi:sigma 54-interacting transcriptional regulator [Vulgatibacter sp.]|uniref:sigma 54-interacting transcriptional regulator n=1 Tax=Vulgatibacter sp. TaxID=1971226 RepID=UPI003566852B